MPKKNQEYIKIKYNGDEGYSVNTATGLIYSNKDDKRVEHPDYSKIGIMMQDGSLQNIRNAAEFVNVINSVNPKFTQETLFDATAGELNKNGLTKDEYRELIQLDSDLEEIDVTMIISNPTGDNNARIVSMSKNFSSVARKK